MANTNQLFSVATFHKTGILAGTHVSTALGGRNEIQKHLICHDVDNKLDLFLCKQGWSIDHEINNRPSPQGPSSSKRSPT